MPTETNSSSPGDSVLTALPSAFSHTLTPEFLTALIDSANDAIISKSLDGIITSWNAGAERIFGYSAEEAIGQSVLMLIPKHLKDEESAIISRIKSGERIEHYETVRCHKNGSELDISLTVSPIKDACGQIIGASKIARLITDIKQANRRLQASQQRYRTLFDSIDEGFCVIEMIFDDNDKAVDWRFLEVNPAFAKNNGLVDATGKTARELIPDLEDFWFELYGKVALSREPVRLQESSKAMNRWFDLYVFPVDEPQRRRVAVLFNDISERKRVENESLKLMAQLKSEQAKLAYLFSKAPAFTATLRGKEMIFDLINPAYSQLIGHRDVVGKPVRQALPEVESQGLFELLDQVLQSGEAYNGREFAVQLQREPQSELEERFVDFVFQPIFADDDSVSGIFVHGVDITEQVLARRNAEAANRAKDDFLATLSHELRTPLNAILGWSALLSDHLLEDEVRAQAVATIQRNAQLQARLIEDILDVSRIVAGKLRLEVRPVELADIIEAAVQAVLPAAQAKAIQLQRVLDSGTSLVSGDSNRLQQVVWNLLSNAIKFTPKGGRVQVRLERIDSHIEIIVSDSGVGISPAVLPFVFERFQQADQTSTRHHGGLGLGLAIVRHLVEMHGGTVEVHSDGENAGSTFTVQLPLIATRAAEPEAKFQAKDQPKSQAQAKAKAKDQPKNQAGPHPKRVHPTVSLSAEFDCPPELVDLRVLVVDDEEDARYLIQTVLERCGAIVTTATNVREALQCVQDCPPNVIVSDLGMPGEDDYSFIKKLRALSLEQGGRTPTAALTAYARVEDRMRVLRSGFQIHLSKPVEPAELVAVVANLAERNRDF